MYDLRCTRSSVWWGLQLLLLILLLLLGPACAVVDAQRPVVRIGRVDSVVLRRTDPATRMSSQIVIRRGSVAAGALDALAHEASTLGFFALPGNVMGVLPACRTVVSDAADAELTFFHAAGSHRVGGYHRCASPSGLVDSLRRLEVHVERRAAQPMTRGSLSVMRDSCPLYPDRPRFAHQVDRPAAVVSHGGHVPRPDPSLWQRAPYSPSYALAQFVVDTGGRPVVGTLKLLVHPPGLGELLVVQHMPRWRFAPARTHGCVVAQLVEMPVRWQLAR